MNIVSQKHPTRIIVFAITVTIAALLGFLIAGRQAHAESVTASSDSHIVTVHDDGVDKGFITNKPTLREALQEADIPIDPKDRTEPALDEKLVARSYQVNVYRARPVLVIDGANQFKVITSYRTGKQIAKEAGLSLHEEDIATLTTATDITETGAAEVLHVKRATKVTFVFYGKSLEVHTFARTVGELVSQKSIIPQANDTLMPAASAPVVADMKIELWRNGEQTVTVDEDIAFETQQVRDANKDKGFKEIQTPGVNGKKTVTYKITMQNGKEVKRDVVNSVTTKEPVKQVETIGVKGVYTTPSENESITWNFLIANGFSREQTAGIMGNLMQEHGFQTSGDGLAQWTGSRKARLMSMPDPYSIQTQLDFLMSELNGGYSRAKAKILASTTVEGATVAFQNDFERCGVCVEGRRIQFAYNILASH